MILMSNNKTRRNKKGKTWKQTHREGTKGRQNIEKLTAKKK
jgi:hypothetical protein